jgi:hypothetical protein
MMKKKQALILMIGLLVASFSQAETKAYADPDIKAAFPEKTSIERQKTISRMLVIFSYKHMKSITVYHTGKDDTFYYSSTKVLLEFDCEKNRSRIIKTFFYSDNEARKNLVYEQLSAGEWKNEVDRSNPKSLIQVACDSN